MWHARWATVCASVNRTGTTDFCCVMQGMVPHLTVENKYFTTSWTRDDWQFLSNLMLRASALTVVVLACLAVMSLREK